MKILALDTSQIQATLCLISDSKLIALKTGSIAVAHSEALLPMIDQILSETGKTLDDFDAFAVGVGPGSFTGIRIGCATIKSLAQVTSKPILPFSSLEALTRSNIQSLFENTVALANAYQGQVFVGWNDGRASSAQFKEDVMSARDWCLSHLKNKAQTREKVSFCGNGSRVYWSQIVTAAQELGLDAANQIELASDIQYISADGILRTVDKKLKATAMDAALVRYSELSANYMRPSQAEIKLEASVAN